MLVAVIGGLILVVALAGAAVLVGRPAPGRERQLRIPLFVLYFWAFVFAELMLAGIAYALWTRLH